MAVPAPTPETDRPLLTIEPPATGWRCELAPSPEKSRFRAQLGLPTGTPIVMSGHQAALWHPGILAKLLGAEAMARRAGACSAWVVVDHDDNDAARVEFPRRVGELAVRDAWRMGPAPVPGQITGARPGLRVTTVPGDSGFGIVDEGLARIGRAMDDAAGAPSLAAQVTACAWSLASGLAAAPVTVMATSLARTDLMHELVDRMRRDPGACVEAYNRAAVAVPRARIRALSREAGRWELPLWRLEDGRRTPVWSDDVPECEHLAARALLMTALLRLGACDLFIHGTGGGVYDRVMEAWIGEWLGRRCAPAAVMSATCYLPLGLGAVGTPEDLSEAVARSRRARHDPGVLGLGALSREKRALAAGVRGDGLTRAERATAYSRMHAWLGEYRSVYAGRIAELETRAADAAGALALASVVYDRTWAFPLYPPGVLGSLEACVREAFGG